MAFRIFDHLLVDHSWSETGRLCIANAPHAMLPRGARSSTAEADSLLARLALRAKSDPVMRRAAKRLLADPMIPFDELARALRVTERYLLSGLRTTLGVDPMHWRAVQTASVASVARMSGATSGE